MARSPSGGRFMFVFVPLEILDYLGTPYDLFLLRGSPGFPGRPFEAVTGYFHAGPSADCVDHRGF
jgi:hypothetical protein